MSRAGLGQDDKRRTPKEGAKFEAFNYSFEIVDMDGHRIDKLLITKLEKPDDEE